MLVLAISLFLNVRLAFNLFIIWWYGGKDYVCVGWCMSCELWVLTSCKHDNCMRWYMKLKWWVWYEFDMKHERVGIIVAWWCYETEFHIPSSRKMNWYGLAGNTKEVNYEKLYMMYVYIFVCMYVESVWLIKKVWSVSVRNPLGSLGEILRVVLQWSGCNSMAFVSGCS